MNGEVCDQSPAPKIEKEEKEKKIWNQIDTMNPDFEIESHYHKVKVKESQKVDWILLGHLGYS